MNSANDSERTKLSREPGLSARSRVRLALNPEAGRHLHPASRFVAAVILISVVLGVLGTEPALQERFQVALKTAELIIGAVFIVEFSLRLWSAGADPRYAGSRGLLRYLRRPLSIIDVVVILALLAPMFGAELAVLRLLRLLRMIALAKFGRYSVALQTLACALKAKRYELSLSVVLASLILLLSATGMYLLEADAHPDAFGSIPRALWWSIATLTTVGYGDVYPVTAAGRVFAGITAIAGIGLIALPAGILASAFSGLSQKNEERP